MEPTLTPGGPTGSPAGQGADPSKQPADQGAAKPDGNVDPSLSAKPAEVDWKLRAEQEAARARAFQSQLDKVTSAKEAELNSLKKTAESSKDPKARLDAERKAFELEKDLYYSKNQPERITNSQNQLMEEVKAWDSEGTALMGKEGEFIKGVVNETSPENAQKLLGFLKSYRESLMQDAEEPEGEPKKPVDFDDRAGGDGKGNPQNHAFDSKSILLEKDPTKKRAMRQDLFDVLSALTAKQQR